MAELTTDIKDYYKDKRVTLVHSRDRLMHKFHRTLHVVRLVNFRSDVIL